MPAKTSNSSTESRATVLMDAEEGMYVKRICEDRRLESFCFPCMQLNQESPIPCSRRPAVQSTPACMAETEDNPDIRLILRLPVTVKSRYFLLSGRDCVFLFLQQIVSKGTNKIGITGKPAGFHNGSCGRNAGCLSFILAIHHLIECFNEQRLP